MMVRQTHIRSLKVGIVVRSCYVILLQVYLTSVLMVSLLTSEVFDYIKFHLRRLEPAH